MSANQVVQKSIESRLSSTFDSSKKQKGYYYIVSPKPEAELRDPIRLSNILNAEDSIDYESVTDACAAKSHQHSTPNQMDVRDNVCPRCNNIIGSRPFCFKCFGPPAPHSKWETCFKSKIPLIMGICITIMFLTYCLAMCLMHMYRVGIYKDDHIKELQNEVETALALIKYLSGFTTGFFKQMHRNMSYTFGNITEVKNEISTQKLKQLKIEEFLNLGCKQYLKISSTTDVGKACNLMTNDTQV